MGKREEAEEAKREGRKAQEDCYSSINAGTCDGPATDNDRACARERGERGNGSDLDRMLGGSWRGVKEEEEEEERK